MCYILILCVITLVINNIYMLQEDKNNCGTMQDIKNDKAVIKNVPKGISICNFGSSHGFYGFDYEVMKEEQICFNFALPSQTLSYDYRILENYQDNIKEDAVIFIVVSYFSCFGKPETEDDQFEAKNKRYYKFLSQDFIKVYDRKTSFYINYVPALLENDIIRLIKSLFGTNMDADMWNMVTDKKMLEQQAYRTYIGHIKHKLNEDGKRLYNQEEISALYDMINFCKKRNITPILITTPYLSEYILQIKKNDATFFDDFYSVLNQVVYDTGVQYYDYSADTRFNHDYSLFFNPDHLNRSGAEKFTSILQEEILVSD